MKQFSKLSHCSIPQSPCCLSVVTYLRGIDLDPAHVEYIQLKIKKNTNKYEILFKLITATSLNTTDGRNHHVIKH